MITAIAGALLVIVVFGFVVWPLMARLPHGRSSGTTPVSVDDATVEALIADYRRTHPQCPRCGLRPEAGATFCSQCGRPLAGREAGSTLDRVEPSQRDADGHERSG